VSADWEGDVDRFTARDWSQIVAQFDDANIYQTSAYGEVRWGAKNLSRLVLKRDNKVVAAAQFRITRPTPLKFGVAYLRWGPLWESRSTAFDTEVPVRMAQAIADEYLKARKLCVRILPNAFVGSERARVFQSAFAKFSCETGRAAERYRTFLVDLGPSIEDLRARLDPKWRNKLRQAEKHRLTVTAGNDAEGFRAFAGIYSQMLKRKAFDTTVDVAEFGRMQDLLIESQRMQVLICKRDDVPVAGLVVTAIGHTAIYLLGATSDAGLDARGAYLLQWNAMQRLKDRGVRWYDLGGIDPEVNPGVYSFKKGFSGADICQIGSLIASESTVSLGIAKAGFALRQTLCNSVKPLLTGPLSKKAAAAG
jgi:lipid II:glycine glycyltransferase (peptidoglycan interpeptide bridge formation enzyme)